MAKAKGRARDFQDPDENVTTDHDPEANRHDSDHSSGSALSEDENAGTEHYVAVGKSRLREKEGVSLGRQYRGSRVSRQALEDETEGDEGEQKEYSRDGAEYDAPETADLAADTAEASSSEIESDDALGESDADRFNGFVFRGSSKPKQLKGKIAKRATAADFMSSSSDEEEPGGADVSDEDMSGVEFSRSEKDEDMEDELGALANGTGSSGEASDGAEEDESQSRDASQSEENGSIRDEGEEPKEQDANPSPGAPTNQSEVEKGTAIRQQRKLYDGLLNMRIRLQKALVAANTFPMLEPDSSTEGEAYEAAEEAAIKLLNTISGLRENIAPPTAAGTKRKRIVEGSMSNEQIWERIQDDDHRATKFRDDRLEKWSRKVQSVTMAAPSKLSSANPKTLINALQEQLANPGSRLIRRTRVPRSCAPAQASKKITESEDIYDDADFYQLLLKELVDQRTVETEAEQSSAVASVMLTANKEAKSRKVVDRKASKGRKMRFTVHEKLQNFMAPEDRRSWEQGAIDRFFGTLFGQKMELNEDESDGDDEMKAMCSRGEGLRLFR